jgi:hypothetical protein
MTARLVLAIGAVAVGCGGAKAPVANPPAASATPSASAAAERPAPPGHLRRKDVNAVLSRGLPLFLQAFPVEASVEGGKFRGWRVMPGADPAYAGGGLAVGDVVVLVNKAPIERPEQALKAWQSLTIAPELRIAFERDGVRRELVFPIDE